MDHHEHAATETGREKVSIPRAPIETQRIGRRVQRACQSCRERKCKCGGEKPSCEQCLTLNVDCVYPSSQREENKATLEWLRSQNEQYKSLLRNIADGVGSIAGDIQHALGVCYHP